MQFRAVSLAFAIVGLFLIIFFVFYSTREMNQIEEEDFHKIVDLEGRVLKERISNDQHYFNVGNVSVICSCKNLYLDGKQVKIRGFVDKYNGKYYVRALRVIVL